MHRISALQWVDKSNATLFYYLLHTDFSSRELSAFDANTTNAIIPEQTAGDIFWEGCKGTEII